MNSAKNNIAISDSTLLAAFIEGRQNEGEEEAAQIAFRELVTRYERLVWTICQRQLNNHCDIGDAFQDTFMLLATKAHRIKKPEALANWLYGVAWKTSAGLRRRRSRLQINLTAEGNDEGLDGISTLVSSELSPFETIAKRYQTETLDRQLSQLSEKYRTPLVLFYFAGLTTRQIADQLAISISAAEGRLRRGRSKLRNELAVQGILLSPILLVANMVSRIQIPTDLVAVTCEQCITTTSAGNTLLSASHSTWSGNLSSGTKVMICKTFVSVAIVSLVAVGGYLHSSPVNGSAAIQIGYRNSSEHDADQEEFSFQASSSDECDDEPTTMDAIHDHLFEVHDRMLDHAHGWLGLFHGESDGELHFDHVHDDHAHGGDGDIHDGHDHGDHDHAQSDGDHEHQGESHHEHNHELHSHNEGGHIEGDLHDGHVHGEDSSLGSHR